VNKLIERSKLRFTIQIYSL